VKGRGGHGQAPKRRLWQVAKKLFEVGNAYDCARTEEDRVLVAALESHINLQSVATQEQTDELQSGFNRLYSCIDVIKVEKGDGGVGVKLLHQGVIKNTPDNDGRLQALIEFVESVYAGGDNVPSVFLTKIHKVGDEWYVHPNGYFPLGILPEWLFIFEWGDVYFAPLEIINALEVCFRTKVSEGVYDTLTEQNDQQWLNEIERMAQFLKNDVSEKWYDAWRTPVLTSRMMVQDRNNLFNPTKNSGKTTRYTARARLLSNVTNRGQPEERAIVTASTKEVANDRIQSHQIRIYLLPPL